jgi:hypothetical protein
MKCPPGARCSNAPPRIKATSSSGIAKSPSPLTTALAGSEKKDRPDRPVALTFGLEQREAVFRLQKSNGGFVRLVDIGANRPKPNLKSGQDKCVEHSMAGATQHVLLVFIEPL